MIVKRSLIVALAALCIIVGVAGVVSADPSPNGPGQPGAPGTTCGGTVIVDGVPVVIDLMPPGQASPGFANAALHYAGSPLNPTYPAELGGRGVGNPDHAISQYDISCFQATMHGTGIPV